MRTALGLQCDPVEPEERVGESGLDWAVPEMSQVKPCRKLSGNVTAQGRLCDVDGVDGDDIPGRRCGQDCSSRPSSTVPDGSHEAVEHLSKGSICALI